MIEFYDNDRIKDELTCPRMNKVSLRKDICSITIVNGNSKTVREETICSFKKEYNNICSYKHIQEWFDDFQKNLLAFYKDEYKKINTDIVIRPL